MRNYFFPSNSLFSWTFTYLVIWLTKIIPIIAINTKTFCGSHWDWIISGLTHSLSPQITSSAVVSLLSKSHPAVSVSQKRLARIMLLHKHLDTTRLLFSPLRLCLSFDIQTSVSPQFLSSHFNVFFSLPQFIIIFFVLIFSFYCSRWWQRKLFLLPTLHRCVTSRDVQSHATRHLSQVGVHLQICYSLFLFQRSETLNVQQLLRCYTVVDSVLCSPGREGDI